jgi:hypothetical protein
MLQKRPLLTCMSCYAVVCIAAVLFSLPRGDSIAEGLTVLAISFPLLPAASFAVIFWSVGLDVLLVPAAVLGYAAHTVSVVVTVVLKNDRRYYALCAFVALLVVDFCAVIMGLKAFGQSHFVFGGE